ncbi:HAMP domain-containing protein, partial [Escherichia coli]
MLKRCLSPLTLVNQVALIVLLSTAIGLAGMAVSGWLVQGVQGSAHAINKAGSLRMQSYRLLAAVPLSEKDKPLIKEMEQTAFSAELTRAAERDGQLAQLQGLQDYWRNELIPALMRAQNRETVSADVSQFVAGLDQLVSGFDRTTEMRIETVVLVHRVMAVFMALLLVFTIIWLRARLLQPWRQLLAMASAVSHRDFTQRANISGRNEMAMLGTALNNMSAELAESY